MGNHIRDHTTKTTKLQAIDCLKQLERNNMIYRIAHPFRPIVGSIDSITYIAKHLSNIIESLVGHTKHHIQNFEEFVAKIKKLKLDADKTISILIC